MKLHPHLIQRESFSVEILGDEMEIKSDLLNESMVKMISSRMTVQIEERKLSKITDRSSHLSFLEKALDDIQAKEDQEGRFFIEDPEIMPVPERSLLIQDGITDQKIRIITFLAITSHQEEDYFSMIRGCIPDDAALTQAFIQSVFETFKS
ncbi:MAG: hypothetical protein V4507_07235 [Verrucomicrobiota bacterium]